MKLSFFFLHLFLSKYFLFMSDDISRKGCRDSLLDLLWYIALEDFEFPVRKEVIRAKTVEGKGELKEKLRHLPHLLVTINREFLGHPVSRRKRKKSHERQGLLALGPCMDVSRH